LDFIVVKVRRIKMSNTTPLRTVIVGCGMIAAGGYQPRCQAYPEQIELVGYYDQDEGRASALAEKEVVARSIHHLKQY
jgi:predicted dehydrogenase